MDEKKPEKNNPENPSELPPRRNGPMLLIMVIGTCLLIALLLKQGDSGTKVDTSFAWKLTDASYPWKNLKDDADKNNSIIHVAIQSDGIVTIDLAEEIEVPPAGSQSSSKREVREKRVSAAKVYAEFDEDERKALAATLRDRGIGYSNLSSNQNTYQMLWLIAVFAMPIAMAFFIWSMYRRSRDQMMGGGFLSSFNKSPAKQYDGEKQTVTFKDVAGLKGVKADLAEIVEFLTEPDKFQKLGGFVPRGVLLLGPPGTGKTLLARAVAGEANVPFYSVNGSEFIQMFVGVGASRVRDLFKTAKENAPSIIFIDEIDAVGRQRGAGLGGGHDEREQTLNQILGEMDGFSQTESVIVVAATNRPDVLDPALLRPGRFDRHITVHKPSKKGREEIFKVHVRNVPLDDDVNLSTLAAGTVGMSGADIRNLVNEAALWAARNDKSRVFMDDFEYARDKILMGSAREDIMLEDEKRKTAYHEAGHALLAWLVRGADRVHKVTVIPRGRALGVTQTLPEEDRFNMTESELHDRLAFILGGREAERLVYNESSAGAENDLERCTQLARRMVTSWGMTDRLGPVSYKLSSDDPFLGREMHETRQFSEHTLQMIDEEVASILHGAASQAAKTLAEHRDKLDILANALVDREEIDEADITELIGPSVNHLHKMAAESEKTPDDEISEDETTVEADL